MDLYQKFISLSSFSVLYMNISLFRNWNKINLESNVIKTQKSCFPCPQNVGNKGTWFEQESKKGGLLSSP